jgi:uncharacterized metal-binding protein YceD (DUF177 family)
MVSPAPLAFARLVRVDPLPRDGLEYTLEADAEERRRLAEFNGILEVGRLKATFRLTAGARGKVKVEGRLLASATQSCVVTLEPVVADIDAPIEVTFVPPGAGKKDSDADQDVIENGAVDLGAVAGEFLTLNLDPYPRKEGAAFEFAVEGEDVSDFAPRTKKT